MQDAILVYRTSQGQPTYTLFDKTTRWLSQQCRGDADSFVPIIDCFHPVNNNMIVRQTQCLAPANHSQSLPAHATYTTPTYGTCQTPVCLDALPHAAFAYSFLSFTLVVPKAFSVLNGIILCISCLLSHNVLHVCYLDCAIIFFPLTFASFSLLQNRKSHNVSFSLMWPESYAYPPRCGICPSMGERQCEHADNSRLCTSPLLGYISTSRTT